MSEINIRRAHHLAPEAVRRLAEAMAVRLEERFELAWHWEGDALRFQRDGVGTYTDYLVGLPGESYESFAAGVSQVIDELTTRDVIRFFHRPSDSTRKTARRPAPWPLRYR